jgi:hypothetical protein
VHAKNQAQADERALAAFYDWACTESVSIEPLGFPKPWDEHDSVDDEPVIDTRFRCVDCGKDTGWSGEYYSVSDEVWAASGLGRHDGMLCLLDLERRIGRLLTPGDFEAMYPSKEAWQRHLAARRKNSARNCGQMG